MKKLFLMALSATMLVACYTQSELDEHKETYEFIAGQAQAQANAAIQAANERVAEIEADLDGANLSIEALENAIQELSAEKLLIEQALAESDTKNAGLETALDNLNDTIADLEGMIASLEDENADLKAQLDALQSNLSAALARIQDLEDNPITITEYITVVETIVETVEVISTVVEVVEVPGETITTGVSQEDLDDANNLIDTLMAELQDLAAANQITEDANILTISDLEEQLSDLVSQYDGLDVTFSESSTEGLLESDAIGGFGFDFNDDGDKLDTYTENVLSWSISNAAGEEIASDVLYSYEITNDVVPAVDPTDVIVSDVSVSQSGGVETLTTAGTFSAWTSNGDGTESRSKTDVYSTSAVIETTVTTYSVNVKGVEDVPALEAPESTSVDVELTAASTRDDVTTETQDEVVVDTADEIISSVSSSQSGGVETLTTAGTFGEWVSNGDGTESRSKTDVYTTSAVVETTVTTYSVQINGVEDSPALVAPGSTSVDVEITAASTRDDVVTETQDEEVAATTGDASVSFSGDGTFGDNSPVISIDGVEGSSFTATAGASYTITVATLLNDYSTTVEITEDDLSDGSVTISLSHEFGESGVTVTKS